MATTHLPTAVRNAMCDACVDLSDSGGAGSIKIYTASQPASANDAVSGTLLATFSLANPAWGAASAGTAALLSTPRTTTGVAAGTAAWFRLTNGSGATVMDGTVSGSGGGGALQLNTTTISNGLSLEITSASFTVPSGE